MSSEVDLDPGPDPDVLARVRAPGSLLIGVGLANLLGGLLLIQTGMRTSRMSAQQFREEQQESAQRLVQMGWMSEEGRRQLEQVPADQQQALLVRGFYAWAGLSLLGSFMAT